ncbi:MAG TPA: glycosyltransferase family 2 protein [Allosphingosinicella sp.]|nr:glycosyltransferase family 2 protein [Allosphingosinicella sp.]
MAEHGQPDPRPLRVSRAEARHEAGSIEVALATYNSERFLPKLLDSLFAQTNQDFTLIVADDGSVDATTEILEKYSREHPGRIRIVAVGRQTQGPAGNFGRLLDEATADYVLLCDHDDVWLPNKISVSLERMMELEAVHPPKTPLLVHTDLTIVDADLELIYPSFFGFSNARPKQNHILRLLMSNVASGCTMIVNRALYERARPIPPDAIMHDHWLALVASALGAIGCIDEPTILYRLHSGNVIGVRSPRAASALERVGQTLLSDNRYRVMMLYSRQAAALLARFGDEMRGAERLATETLANIDKTSRWQRFVQLRRSGLGLRGFVRNAALLIAVTRGSASERKQ